MWTVQGWGRSHAKSSPLRTHLQEHIVVSVSHRTHGKFASELKKLVPLQKLAAAKAGHLLYYKQMSRSIAVRHCQALNFKPQAFNVPLQRQWSQETSSLVLPIWVQVCQINVFTNMFHLVPPASSLAFVHFNSSLNILCWLWNYPKQLPFQQQSIRNHISDAC